MKTCELTINGLRQRVPEGTTVAAAIANAGETLFRKSRSGAPRAPLCGMGVCFGCRVTINGKAHCRSCQTICSEGMEIRTDG